MEYNYNSIRLWYGMVWYGVMCVFMMYDIVCVIVRFCFLFWFRIFLMLVVFVLSFQQDD